MALCRRRRGACSRLALRVHTAENYLVRICEKLEVSTRTGAAAKALKEGLL